MNSTKLYLDSGNPQDSKDIMARHGKLEGQTTNPSLVAQNPGILNKAKEGKLTQQQLLQEYRSIISEISNTISGNSVSIEVYADKDTTAQQMIEQALIMNSWTDKAYIKLPITEAGLQAASVLSAQGVKLNLTLCFSQEQALAVHLATKNSPKGSVYVSPFIGRLDDIGQNGIDLIANILQMYRELDSHVYVLAASIRNLYHLQQCIGLQTQLTTSPLAVIDQYYQNSAAVQPTQTYAPIAYTNFDSAVSWNEYNIAHELTDKGLAAFAQAWNNLIA